MTICIADCISGCACIWVFHDKIKFYILSQTCFNDSRNDLKSEMVHETNSSYRSVKSHLSQWPHWISIRLIWSSDGQSCGFNSHCRQLCLLKLSKLLDVNSGLKCKSDLTMKNSIGWYFLRAETIKCRMNTIFKCKIFLQFFNFLHCFQFRSGKYLDFLST